MISAPRTRDPRQGTAPEIVRALVIAALLLLTAYIAHAGRAPAPTSPAVTPSPLDAAEEGL